MRGFTLIEVIVVIAILGMIAALVIPALGVMDNEKRIQITEENLEKVRAAILGPRDAVDENGRPQAGGYVADIGALPLLYTCLWNEGETRWDWGTIENQSDAAFIDGEGRPLGHPRGIWENQWQDQTGAGNPDVYLGDRWSGPYISFPRDMYPADADHYAWDYGSPNGLDNDEIRMRRTRGRFSDGWGRALIFWRDDNGTADANDDTLWIISEGPDRKSDWTGLPGSVAWESAAKNEDNVILKIMPAEWYDGNVGIKVFQTRGTLLKICTALIGTDGACDDGGERIVGGYIGDFGAWPELWYWDGTDWDNVGAAPWRGMIRGLWVQDASLPDYGNGCGWRGPYVRLPWGSGEDETITDAWNRGLECIYENASGFECAPENASLLSILSAGPDGMFSFDCGVAAADDDNIAIDIDNGTWKAAAAVTITGHIYNGNAGNTQVRLWRTRYQALGPVTLDCASNFAFGAAAAWAGPRLMEYSDDGGTAWLPLDNIFIPARRAAVNQNAIRP